MPGIGIGLGVWVTNKVKVLTEVVESFLKTEDGGFLLQEDGFKIIITTAA